MSEIYKKMVDESMAAQRADVETVKKNRGKEFKLKDTKSYVDVANKMIAIEGQAQSVIDLHVSSVNTHFNALSGLTDTVRPEDDPFVEHYQTPAILEILCEEDESFHNSLKKFIDTIDDCEALIGKEVIRRYGGFYGPTCVVDFALIPGSTSNVVNQILLETKIPENHKQAILAAKSWAMNTSYGLGEIFANSLEFGDTATEAVKKEISIIKKIYETPVKAQAELMDDAGQISFDVRKYMDIYKNKMRDTTIAAVEDNVHYGNILTIPAYCVGDISHHISQSTYNMCKDDMIMGIIEATTEVIDKALNDNLGNFKSEYDVLSLATGSSASAVEYILELDGMNAIMIVDLLTKRFHNFVQQFPTRGAAAELHNCDFMDMIYRGWGYLDKARRMRSSEAEKLKPTANGFEVDLDPIRNHQVVMNPQRYTYPACAISVRFSSLMRLADYPCLLTSEPITATMMTNITALHKEIPASPVRACKNCASAALVDFRHSYCQWKEAI
ncbi:hypothetical protein MBCUT_17220 [Methanobrevibacter cuticularis]|uniref:DUF2193 domain-containing protein n=1 Tax=Methanobrevibacter cuticularis TaxID=47311 RepID=A0A166D192_9EURY|nr:DUF2193 domain-containing protein [Methanobrevibacter cuticularis]KZX15099.1 hypothetical protein MBCUT_17220 [Methanobrevibacter cuticularis]